jgi:hypothetical protein
MAIGYWLLAFSYWLLAVGYLLNPGTKNKKPKTFTTKVTPLNLANEVIKSKIRNQKSGI